MRLFCLACLMVMAVGTVAFGDEAPSVENLRLNQIQVVATHNSYHLRPPAGLLKAAIAIRKDAKTWDYSRQPLDEQLDQGVRSFELDLHLSKDGWKVMHVPTFDAGTTVPTFAEALRMIRKWSEAHPRHVPISLLLELKEEGYALNSSFKRPEADDVVGLDALIRSELPNEKLLAPDDVRGEEDSLWEAIRAEGWPTLGDCAGKVFLILHERGANRTAYLEGHPALEGRAMFVESEVGEPHSAVLIRNDPLNEEIDDLAQEGYLIRTRADTMGDLDPKRRERALASGAHLLTTDYPRGEVDADAAFCLPEGSTARVHLLTGPEELRGKAIVEPIP